jgi:hypothetical protein
VIAGTYSFVYCGANDVGMGQFIIGQDGGFAGADLGGVCWLDHVGYPIDDSGGDNSRLRDRSARCAAHTFCSRLLATRLR